jgi:hypothetical protein
LEERVEKSIGRAGGREGLEVIEERVGEEDGRKLSTGRAVGRVRWLSSPIFERKVKS